MEAADTSKSPEAVCMEQETKEMLLMNCRRLKKPYDEIAKAYYYDEMDVREIAGSRGMKVKTVQTQVYRARSMLRKIYRKENSA